MMGVLKKYGIGMALGAIYGGLSDQGSVIGGALMGGLGAAAFTAGRAGWRARGASNWRRSFMGQMRSEWKRSRIGMGLLIRDGQTWLRGKGLLGSLLGRHMAGRNAGVAAGVMR
jgi:hypothetical protein